MVVTQFIYKDSKLSASFMQCYICFLPGWSEAEMKCTVHVDLPKRPINGFKLDQQKRQQVLRAYCPNIYILWVVRIIVGTKMGIAQLKFSHFLLNSVMEELLLSPIIIP